MNTLEYIHFKTRESFRKWLVDHHGESPGIWMIYYKKHTNRQNITYEEAMEEALCFGWIDSIIKRLDEDRYARKFTPRTNHNNWSPSNRKRAEKLINNGMMQESGLLKIGNYAQTGKVAWEKIVDPGLPKSFEVPDYITQTLAKHEPALSFFEKLAPSHKRNYVLWITDAKKEETRQRRLKQAVEMLKKGKKSFM